MPSAEKPGTYTLKAVFDSGPLTGKVSCAKQIQILSPAAAALAAGDTASQSPLFGLAAPALHADHWLQGQPTTLAKLRGKVVLLDFWATWCVPCVGEFPQVQRFYEETKNKGIAVVSLAVADDPAATLKRIIAQRHVTFPVMVDATPPMAELLGATFNAYGVRAIPRQVVIDQQGMVRYNGQSLPEAMRIARVLATKGVGP